jgi:hypothetical protein
MEQAMRLGAVAFGIVAPLLFASALGAQEQRRALGDEELKAHLEALGRKVDDPSTDLFTRARLAQEMASTLDRAALAATSAKIRRERWAEAASILEGFTEKNPDQPQARAFPVQAAIYLWARARTWMQAYEADRTDVAARDRAVEALNDALKRLKPAYLALNNANDVFAQNVRFRTAQALADLAAIGPFDPVDRVKRTHEALVAIWDPVSEPGLAGHAHLLRGTLQYKERRYEEALAEIDAAAKATPAPAAGEILDARVSILIAKKEFTVARRAIEESTIDGAAKPGLMIRVQLAELAEKPEGAGRDRVETELFRQLETLTRSKRSEARSALIAVATSLHEPGAAQASQACDLLAEGAVALGDLDRAAALEREAAGRAETLGQAEKAAEFRLKAGAFLYQAEKFAEADPLLTSVAEDSKAGPARPRAGMLRALARGRALALGRPGGSPDGYTAALEYQIKSFPDDPSTAEARWLLGKLRLAESDRAAALALWSAIPHGGAHWLDSRIEIASIFQHDLDNQRLNNDRDGVARRLEEARDFFSRCLAQAQGEEEMNDLLLAKARFELTPGVGRPAETLKIWQRLQRSVAGPAQRDAARRLDLVALAQLNRWVEADHVARLEANLSEPSELIEVVRLLDRSAAEADSDLKTRRIGLLMGTLIARMIEQIDSFAPGLRAEVRLRHVRALVFSGDDSGARRALGLAATTPLFSDGELLRDLADTYSRLGAYSLAIDVQRLRSRQLPTGSLPWFDARYGLALAYFRAGKSRDAMHLIDATAILHPDLGGGELRDKFIRLRQRINPND